VPRPPEGRDFAAEATLLLKPDPDLSVQVDVSVHVQVLESTKADLQAAAVQSAPSARAIPSALTTTRRQSRKPKVQSAPSARAIPSALTTTRRQSRKPKVQSAPSARAIPSESLALIDWQQAYLDLLAYKERKGLNNLLILPETPRQIVAQVPCTLIAEDSVLRPKT
jgi:hypothetical protein